MSDIRALRLNTLFLLLSAKAQINRENSDTKNGTIRKATQQDIDAFFS